MSADDAGDVTVIRGRAGFKSEAILTLDARGMRLTHPRGSLEFDVAWSDVEEAKVISVLKQNAGSGGSPQQPIASFRLKREPPSGFFARLKSRVASDDQLVAGVFKESPEAIVELIERYRLRYAEQP